MGSDICL